MKKQTTPPPAELDLNRIPQHVAVIMDGNGRWAKQRGSMRVFGHRNAIQAVRDIAESAAEIGVGYLTLYAFSIENWHRPQREIDALMELLVATLREETPTLQKNDIRLSTIGDTDGLPNFVQRELNQALATTQNNQRMCLTLALNYGGQSDIAQAARKLAEEVQAGNLAPEAITPELMQRSLSTAFMPYPELLIRTSGERRISNFLLWELAYTEFYITDTFWPDFRRGHFYEALLDFQQRERRFGHTGEQVQTLQTNFNSK